MDISMDISMDIHIHGKPGFFVCSFRLVLETRRLIESRYYTNTDWRQNRYWKLSPHSS